jgi:hypothetical protein
MAIEFDIQVRNGRVRITVGGPSAGKPDTQEANGGSGKNFGTGPGGSGKNFGTGPGGSGTNFGTGPGGDEPGSDCCCPVVIGPIVISGDVFANGGGSEGGSGKNFGTGPGGSGENFGTGPGGSGANFGTGPGGSGKNFGTGPGGSGSATGCRGPVIIGPIVISGCCSGQDPASSDGSDGDTTSTSVTVNPPGQVVFPNMARPFIMQTQQESFWCWAAVAVSVNDFLASPKPGVGTTWTQPTLATELLKGQGVATANCSETPGSETCNQPETLDAALAITGNLMADGALPRQHLTFECIQNWVNAQIPVAARIKWRGNGAHFVVLDGCKVLSTGQQMVHVQDPASTTVTSPGFWDYDAFVENYEEAGFWVDTYLLTAN